MRVSLLEFIQSGDLGPVVYGFRATELEAVLGPPEMTGGETRRYKKPCIWKYGNVEFYFDWLAGLDMIFWDTFSGPNGEPEGWGQLELDPWCIREGLSLNDFTREAHNKGCGGEIIREPHLGRDLVRFASGVEVAFERAESAFTPVGLSGVWRTTRG